MSRIRIFSLSVCSLVVVAFTAPPASAYGSTTPPVKGKWAAFQDKYSDRQWHGTFTITHGPVTVHNLTFVPRFAATTCDTAPLKVVGAHRMHLYTGINPHHLRYTAWAIGRNTPKAPDGYVISPVKVTFEQSGRQFTGKIRIQIQFPRGGATPKTDGSVQYVGSGGEDCEFSFNVRKT